MLCVVPVIVTVEPVIPTVPVVLPMVVPAKPVVLMVVAPVIFAPPVVAVRLAPCIVPVPVMLLALVILLAEFILTDDGAEPPLHHLHIYLPPPPMQCRSWSLSILLRPVTALYSNEISFDS
jgi:hypothetical protein